MSKIGAYAETHEGYQCSCGDLYPDEDDAKACCPDDVDAETLYECQGCGEEFESDSEAVDCCLEQITVAVKCPECSQQFFGTDGNVVKQAQRCCRGSNEIERYPCPKCEETYEDSDQAGACCATVEAVTYYECESCTYRSLDKWKAMQHCR